MRSPLLSTRSSRGAYTPLLSIVKRKEQKGREDEVGGG
jgi:hypothetical protein